MVNYPAQIDNSLSIPLSVDNNTPVTASVTNRLREAIIAIESELGIKPGGVSTVRARFESINSTLENLDAITLGGDIGGTVDTPLIIGLQGRLIADTEPSTDDVLTWNGLAWAPAVGSGGGTPGGSNTQIQFNDSDDFGGDIGLTYNKTTNVLSIGDAISVGDSPATIGSFRLPSQGNLTFRNTADNDDLDLITSDASNRVRMGSIDNFVIITPDGGDGGITATGELVYGVGSGQEHYFHANAVGGARIGAGYISTGAIPATAGNIRLPNLANISARKADNSADISLVDQDSSNILRVGDLTHTVNARLLAAVDSGLAVAGGASYALLSSGLFTLTGADLVIGATPAGAGIIRIPNFQTIFAHDGASGKVAIASVDASANLVLGADPAGALNELNSTYLYSSNTIYLAIGGSAKLNVDGSLTSSANPIALGTTPATVGDIRLPNTFNVSRRNGANDANETIFACTSDTLSIAGPASGTSGQFFSNLVCNAFSAFQVSINGTVNLSVDSSGATMAGATLTAGKIQMNSGTYLEFQTLPATTGHIRLPTGGSTYARNAADSANIKIFDIDGSDVIRFGESGATAAVMWAAGSVGLYSDAAGGYAFLGAFSGSNQNGLPIIGYNQPWGIHGGIEFTFVADADYTVTSAQYVYDWLEFITGSWASGHAVIFPHPASKADGYYKTIFNNTAYTMTVSTGTGTTKTLATTLAERFWFDDGGVSHAGTTFTP